MANKNSYNCPQLDNLKKRAQQEESKQEYKHPQQYKNQLKPINNIENTNKYDPLAGLDKNKSFKPKKKIDKQSRGYGLKQIAKMTLGSGNMIVAVELPGGEDLNEWLAINTIEFYNEISLLYGIILEFCTQDDCPIMSAGPKYEYLWADGQSVKTPLKVSAQEYIDYLMSWVENQLNNEHMFPCQIGVPFPRNFISTIRVIFKRLFRV